MILLFTGEQVDWTIKQSEPRTDSNRETAISPSLKGDFPQGKAQALGDPLGYHWVGIGSEILMSFP